MQSVLKKWLLAGSAIRSRISFALSAVAGWLENRLWGATPLRWAAGRLAEDIAAFLQVIGLRLFVWGVGTTRRFAPGTNICANSWPSSVGPCTGTTPPFGKAGTSPGCRFCIDKNIHGAGAPAGSPAMAMAFKR